MNKVTEKFNPKAKQPYVVSVELKKIIDNDSDTSYIGEFSNTPGEGAINHRERSSKRNVLEWFNPANPEYAEQDYKRMMEIENEDVCFYGVIAEAFIHIPGVSAPDSVRSHEISSSGLWGIESDSDDSYFKEVGDEQLEDLRLTLEKLNVDLSDWNEMIKNVEWGD